MIVFADESGFSQRPSVRRTWGPRGQTPVLRELANFVPDDMDQLHGQITRGARRIRRHSHLLWGFLQHAQLLSHREIKAIPYLYKAQ